LRVEASNLLELIAQQLEAHRSGVTGCEDVDDPTADELQRILDLCLAKNPDHRYASTTELCADLDRIRRSVQPSPRGGNRRLRRPILVAAAVAAAAVVVWRVALHLDDVSDVRTRVPIFANPIQVTSALGAEDFPAWSRDGQSLAYQSNRDGNWDIWISKIAGGEPFNRTHDHRGEDLYPSWSPDGSRLAFWSDRDGSGYYVMSALAGSARKIVDSDAAGPLHWSADGTELTYVTRDHTDVYFETVSLEGGEKRRIRAPGDNVFRVQPSWSPDGRLVAYMDASAYNSVMHPLLLFRTTDSEHFAITGGRTRIWNATWSSNGRRLYYVSSRGGSGDLWQQTISEKGDPAGEPLRVTTGMGLRNASVSPSGRKLAYSRGRRMVNLWKIPIFRDRVATWADATPLTFDEAFVGFVGLANRREDLLFSSDRQGNQDIWAMSSSGGAMRQLTNDPATDLSPVGSPDGKTIAFYSNRAGSRDIWIMPASGGAARKLTNDPAEDWHPDWSPDGRHVAFVSTRAGSRDIWVIPVEGGEPRQLTDAPGSEQFPKWSPDGRSILFLSGARLWIVPAEGGEPVPVTPKGQSGYPRWTPDGKRIYWVQLRASTGRLWEFAMDTGETRPVTDLEGRPGTFHGLVLATDGDYLYFGWDEDLGDIWVVDLVEP